MHCATLQRQVVARACAPAAVQTLVCSGSQAVVNFTVSLCTTTEANLLAFKTPESTILKANLQIFKYFQIFSGDDAAVGQTLSAGGYYHPAPTPCVVQAPHCGTQIYMPP